MSNSIRSMAIMKAHAGKEPEMLAFLREFYAMMDEKKYSRDILFHDQRTPGNLVHIRIWLSEQARATAMHDPDVHHYWIKLPELGTITTIYEELQMIYPTPEAMAGAPEAGL